MTLGQVTAILSELNIEYPLSSSPYALDTWMYMDEVSAILLDTDENIYPDSHNQVLFDSVNELIRTRVGNKQPDGSFEVGFESIISPMSSMFGIVMVDESRTKSPFKRGVSA